MPKKATAEDAQIIMRLYDLRREPEMRKARHWYAGWWPRSADDILKVLQAGGTQENAWFRQVNGYWDMAASFVLHGVVNESLFFDSSGELWFVLAKLQPFLKEVRQRANIPQGFVRVEKVATRTKDGRDRLQMFLKRADASRAAIAGNAP
ncbi:MAG TPA: hypothetical protein VL349_00890 [Terriglobales bacterium]|jgi:hypothetical protein|nr:hypothetical protein [Terriglobales bacterium]